MIPDGALAIVAGGDTTARAISNLFFAILAHPAHYERLKNELETAFPAGEGILNVERYAELKFLDALMYVLSWSLPRDWYLLIRRNETLRLYPPVPTNGPRRVPDASKARVICDKYVKFSVPLNPSLSSSSIDSCQKELRSTFLHMSFIAKPGISRRLQASLSRSVG